MSKLRKPFSPLLTALSVLTLALSAMVIAVPSEAKPPNGTTTCTQWARCGCCATNSSLQNFGRECYLWYNGQVEESWMEEYCSGPCTVPGGGHP